MVLTQTKAVPVYGGKWHGEAMTKGERLKAAKCHEMFPLSFAYAQQLPRKRWSLLGAVRARRTVPYPFAERSFQWGYGGCRGPKGRNRNLPWPPAKKVIRKLLSLLFISTPKSIAKPSPGWNKVARGAFWCALQLKHSHGRPPMTAPTTLHINFWDNQGDASRPHNFTISHAHPPSGGFHIAQAIFHCASAQFHPFARTDFTARVSPLIFRIRRFQR